jgi:Phytanoyl-CoA dioxygenase (PhyH)
MSSTTATRIDIRDVNDAEVDSFWEVGWVKLPGLISSEAAGDLLKRAKAILGENADDREIDAQRHRDFAGFRDYYRISEVDELFRAFRLSTQSGRNAARLFDRDMQIRSVTDLLAVKMPASKQGTVGRGADVTEWHQDHGAVPVRGNSLAFWVALDEVTPEMGSVCFYEGSHRLGQMGWDPTGFPRVQKCPLSAPLTLAPGDATAHLGLVVHGAPENKTERPRWGYICNYFPGRAPYTGAPSHHLGGAVIESGQPLDLPAFPVVYDPET